jgi:NitT/TauT family transport system ATP-binding protein
LSKLSVRNIRKSYVENELESLLVLNGISFNLEEQEFLGILGPSGCGKTTLLKIIAGLLEPDEGEILIDNTLVNCGHHRVGYIFQQESLFPWRTVRQNIEFGLELHGINPEERRRRSDELITLIGMKGLEENYPDEISGGQARKTEIARSLITSPDFLVSDECFSNLDAQTRNYLQEEFLRIWKETGSTIIFVSHNVDEVVFMSDRILVMSNIPSKIIAEYELDIPRPRDRTSHECLEYRAKILALLKVEQEKSMLREIS